MKLSTPLLVVVLALAASRGSAQTAAPARTVPVASASAGSPDPSSPPQANAPKIVEHRIDATIDALKQAMAAQK